MSDLGEISYYFVMEVDVEIEKKISLWQTTYLIKILPHFQMCDCQPVTIFMNQRVANSLFFSESEDNKITIQWYQSAIRLLIWHLIHI